MGAVPTFAADKMIILESGAAANQIVDFGTNKANIVLPKVITARTTSAAIKIQINVDGWSSCPEYNEKQSGTYI